MPVKVDFDLMIKIVYLIKFVQIVDYIKVGNASFQILNNSEIIEIQ